jgi:hypothetical protein
LQIPNSARRDYKSRLAEFLGFSRGEGRLGKGRHFDFAQCRKGEGRLGNLETMDLGMERLGDGYLPSSDFGPSTLKRDHKN